MMKVYTSVSEMVGRTPLFEPVRYAAVTAEQVRTAAKELFRKGNSSVLYYLKKC